MLKIIPCIYHNGKFVLEIPVDFPDGARVDIAFCRNGIDSDAIEKADSDSDSKTSENFVSEENYE